jgi:hypothetical protein
MINYLNFQKLRNAVFLQFIDLLIELLTDNDPAELKLSTQVAIFENLMDRAGVQFKKPRSSKLTASLNALDLKRDQLLVGISQISNGYLKHWDANYSTSAKNLTEDIKRYGAEIYNLNVQEKSTIVEKMTAYWTTDSNLTQALELLHLDEWAFELEHTNNEYVTKYILRTKNESAKSPDTFKKVRKEMMVSYKALSKLLIAYETIDTTGKYVLTIAQINALIDQYNTLINRQKPRNKKNKDDGGAEPMV